MKRKLIALILAGLIGTGMYNRPQAAEREVIDVDWDLTYYAETEAEAEAPAEPQYDRALLARVCMGEAGTEAFIGQVAVVATILNRCDINGQTVAEVVYAPNQYYTGFNGAPSEQVLQAVDFAIEQRGLFPADMIYFRTKHYHSFGKPYTVIGNHYFSTKGE
jgi:N-acetylmuramoyl-L-alanine amidase